MTIAGAGAGQARPTFIGIGAGKSGTTWLWSSLRKHPDVYLPDEKELQYFNDESYEGVEVANPRASKPLSWYLSFFEGATAGQVCGEITPSYLWSESAPRRIHEFDPDVRLFALLRDPVARVFSSYLFSRQKGEIAPVTFEDALEKHGYIAERTLYARYLRRYYDLFPARNIKVMFYEDLRADPASLLLDVEEFIGVRAHVPEGIGERENVTGASRFPGLTRRLMQSRIALKRHGLEGVVELGNRVGVGAVFRFFQRQVRPYDERPRLEPATEARLRDYFRSDIEDLERLLGVDLTAWKVGDTEPSTR